MGTKYEYFQFIHVPLFCLLDNSLLINPIQLKKTHWFVSSDKHWQALPVASLDNNLFCKFLQSMYYRRIKLVSTSFIINNCNIFSKVWKICCLGTLFDHLNLSPNFQRAAISFFSSYTKNYLIKENSRNLTESSMSKSKIIWVST